MPSAQKVVQQIRDFRIIWLVDKSTFRMTILPLLVAALICVALPVRTQVSYPTASQSLPSENEIVAEEESMWGSFVGGQIDELGAKMLPDFSTVSQKTMSREETLNAAQQLHLRCQMAPVSINHPEVLSLSPNVATIVYSTTLTRTCDHRTINTDYNISTTWVRRDGRWRMGLQLVFVIGGFAVQSE
ncbi:MAG: nuclear transport factor 2 family protein [Terracidiphilus sp.]